MTAATAELDTKQADTEQMERIAHYRDLIENDPCMTIHHLRVYNHWYAKVGPPLAYELARTAYLDNGRYLILRAGCAAS